MTSPLEEARDRGVWPHQKVSKGRYIAARREIVPHVREGEYENVLYAADLGSSTGNYFREDVLEPLEELVDVPVESVAIDREISVLERNGWLGNSTHQLRADISGGNDYGGTLGAVPLKNNSMDVVTLLGLSSHLPGEWQSRHLREVTRILKEDGIAVLELDRTGATDSSNSDIYSSTGEALEELERRTHGFDSYPLEIY